MVPINRFFKNNKLLQQSMYLLLVTVLSITFYRFTENSDISSFIPVMLGVLSPFIYGIIIAYILNSGVRFVENKIFLKFKFFKKNPSQARVLSIAFTFILLLGAVLWIIAYIIPEILSSIQNVANFIIEFDFDTIEVAINKFIAQHNITVSKTTVDYVMSTIDSFIESMVDNVKYIPNMLNSIMSGTLSIASSLINLIMGIFIAFYILADKEKIAALATKVIYGSFARSKADNIINLASFSNATFEKFFIGKTIDSLIIGVIFFLGALILDLPYAMLLSIIIGITNMIPYFGPFIGAVPVSILTLLVSPVKTIWVILFIIVLQQFDGIILGPKILGNSIGLKPIGVIFAIIIGGAIAGPLGMFFGVPIFGVLFTIALDIIETRYKNKLNIPQED